MFCIVDELHSCLPYRKLNMTSHIHPVPSTPRRLRGKLPAFIAILATAVALTVVPAATASAKSIDCSYTPGLAGYIGSGRDGVTCAGGGTTGGGGSTGSSS